MVVWEMFLFVLNNANPAKYESAASYKLFSWKVILIAKINPNILRTSCISFASRVSGSQ